MIINFETKDFGIIEIDTTARKAYFRLGDIEVDLNKDDTFRSINGNDFRILYPLHRDKGHIKLQVLTYFTIAQEKLS